MTKHPIQTVEHPHWCDRQRCQRTDRDIRHISKPAVLKTNDQVFTIEIVRDDEDMFPGKPGGTELRLTVDHTVMADVPQAEIILCHEESKALAHQLLAGYYTAATH